MRSTITVVAVLCAVWLGFEQRAQACSCVFATIENNYEFSDHVVRVRAIASFGVVAGQRYYLARVGADAYKGCLRERRLVLVRTASDSATCGYALRPNTDYLLFAGKAGYRFGLPVLDTSLCSGNEVYADLTDRQQAFLDTRYTCCDGECACHASELAPCFADPCQVNSCEVEGATCRANYCGGCHDEWTDADGVRACL